MKLRLFVLSYTEEGAGDGYARHVCTSMTEATREARTAMQNFLDQMRKEESRFGDTPKSKRADVHATCNVSEYIVEGPPRAVVLRCVTLQLDGASVCEAGKRARVELVRWWNWNAKTWRLEEAKTPAPAGKGS